MRDYINRLSRVRGYVPGGSIFKDKDNIVAKQ